MLTETDYNGFLDLLYAAPVERRGWEPVIARFADLTGGAQAWMPDLDTVTGAGPGVLARIDPKQAENYNAHFASINPFIKRYATGPWPLTVMTDEDSFRKDEFVRTEYFNDFFKPQNIHSAMVVRLARRNGVLSTLNIARPERLGQFGREDLAIARRLHPHLIRAFTLSRRFAELGAFNDDLVETLDYSLHGFFLLDREGRINHANAAAQRLLREKDGLYTVAGRLSAGRGESARQLEALIGHAAGRAGSGRVGGSMALPTPSRILPLSLTVVPLRSERLLAWTGFSVLVCVTDLEAGVSLPQARLRQLFGLSPAECRVALALFEGADSKQAALKLGLSVLTVRTHLARILAKTRTNRQTELMRLMMLSIGFTLD